MLRAVDRHYACPGVSMSKPADDLDAYMTATAKVLDLAIAPEWQSSVRANLETTLRLARLVEQFELPDDAEPAFVYKA